MIQEAIDYVFQQGMQQDRVLDIHDNGESVEKLILTDAGKSEIREYSKPPAPRDHALYSLDDFVLFLKSDHAKDGGVITVNENDVVADLAYTKHSTFCVRLPLKFSTEFLALQELFKGIGHRELWSKLISDLDGCIDEALLASLSMIHVSASTVGNTEIKSTGVQSASISAKVDILCQAKEGADKTPVSMKTEWTFTGRLWEYYDETCEIDLRMEVDVAGKENEKKLVFKFHPKKLERIKSDMRASLVERLRGELSAEKFTVIQGDFGELSSPQACVRYPSEQ